MLTDIAKHFGVVTGSKGDAAESLEWLCLFGTSKQGRWVLWLLSSEIDGGRVGELQLRTLVKGEHADSRCGKLKGENVPLSLPIALQLGISRSVVVGALGKPSSSTGDVVEYLHEHEERVTDPGATEDVRFTAVNGVTVLFRSGVVHAFSVWKSSQF